MQARHTGMPGSSGAKGDGLLVARSNRNGTGAGTSIVSGPGILAAPTLPMMPSLGPYVQVPVNFSEQNSRRIVLALESGLRGEMAWALNALTTLTYCDKDDPRRDSGPLARVPGLLDALLHVVDEWRTIMHPQSSDFFKGQRMLGAQRDYTGFGFGDGPLDPADPLYRLRYPVNDAVDQSTDLPNIPAAQEQQRRPHGRDGISQKDTMRNDSMTGMQTGCQQLGSTGIKKDEQISNERRQGKPIGSNVEYGVEDGEWWLQEDDLFNLDEGARSERQQCAVAASNVVRNLSYAGENEAPMAAHRRCIESLFLWMEDHEYEDDELVTNAVDTLVNLASQIDFRIFQGQRGESAGTSHNLSLARLLAAWKAMLDSPVHAWHAAAADALGRSMINPDNEAVLLPFGDEVLERLVDLLGSSDLEVVGTAVGAVASYADLAVSCRLRIAANRWAVQRLLGVLRAPHPVLEVCRKAVSALESVAQEAAAQPLLQPHEGALAELAMSENKVADGVARVLWELSSDISNRTSTARSIWGG